MNKTRLEAFSDGVIAILITILVFDLKAPVGSDVEALKSVIPMALAYLMSFVYVGIYWNNHHHMLHAAHKVNGLVLWANLHLLFWLSLLPFATSWLRLSGFSSLPTAVYGSVLLLSAMAYIILQAAIIKADGPKSELRKAIGADTKGKLSPLIYIVGIATAFFYPTIAIGLYVLVSLLWLIPDPRVEARAKAKEDSADKNKKV